MAKNVHLDKETEELLIEVKALILLETKKSVSDNLAINKALSEYKKLKGGKYGRN